ncbi:NACHT and WD repeat domain-containing protein 2-like isoform X2 [Daphnia pulex]|uniref:NACHT and WD repeat domain-containing protein 2-like isoform X2 n=1 Tax=Daphnia pulex TaxID=6669 RepID=UPI001EDD3E40|nr:NACHT and WD repeat domain-containing protein 2-like isoform X2 [Daphnia pulex]
MDDQTVDKIFAGSLGTLPPVSSKIVRIFTSSTFTDTSMERNTLMATVYPKLKEYCREKHGLEFQVVDMRWGVRDEATDDHMTTELCMKEIENCQRLSMGPNFVVFLGQKYGYRPIPTYILASELAQFREILLTMGQEVILLDTWYKKDSNAVPPICILQPISSILVNFNNKRVPKLQQEDQAKWWDTLDRMQKLLRKAATTLYAQGQLDFDSMHNYLMSVTEREVINGLLKVRNTKNHVLAYVRYINNINLQNLRRAGLFIDIANRALDAEAVRLLANLRDERMPAKIEPSNLMRYTVEWIGRDGLANDTHDEYLQNFISHFYRNIARLVDRAMRKEDSSPQGQIVTEILQHLHACNNSVKVFYGRENDLEKVRRYILGPSIQPLTLFGAGGCGKTSLLARSGSLIITWLTEAQEKDSSSPTGDDGSNHPPPPTDNRRRGSNINGSGEGSNTKKGGETDRSNINGSGEGSNNKKGSETDRSESSSKTDSHNDATNFLKEEEMSRPDSGRASPSQGTASGTLSRRSSTTLSRQESDDTGFTASGASSRRQSSSGIFSPVSTMTDGRSSHRGSIALSTPIQEHPDPDPTSVPSTIKINKPIKPVLIMRYLGTTPDSSAITPMLISLCQQISYNYMIPFDAIPDDLVPLTAYFKQLLALATREQPLLVFLDSVDQIGGAQDANKMAWLPTRLPPFCKIVVSCVYEPENPEISKDCQTLRRMIDEEDNFIHVLALGEELASQVIRHWMRNSHRDLTNYQWRVVSNAIARCSLPIFVKLVFAEICRWKSYSRAQETHLASNVMDSIMMLFERIEIQHGRILVFHALAYITASKSGLSETELEDLLSLDDRVLDDVYQYHMPPVRRIPPLLWTRIRNDLPNYLSEREADGVSVLNWYHRQFKEAAKERYFKNQNLAIYFHSSIAEYFMGTWGGGNPKPFKYTEIQRMRFNLAEKEGEADRKVPLQPLVFVGKDGKVSRYNLRKFGELPYHLVRARRLDDLFHNVLFHYQWLHAKLSSCPLQAVLSDFEDTCNNLEDREMSRELMLVADALRLGGAILTQYPDLLASQLIGRLLPEAGANLNVRRLLEQCDKEGINNCALMPTAHCLHTPGGPLKYSLEGHQFAVFGVCLTSDARFVVSVSNKFLIWDLSTSDLTRAVNPGIEGVFQGLILSPDDRFAAAWTNNSQTIILNLLTSEQIVINNPLQEDETVRGACLLDTHCVLYGQSQWVLLTMQGVAVEIRRERCPLSQPQFQLLSMDFESHGKYHVVFWTGDLDDKRLVLQTINDGQRTSPLELHSAMVMNRKRDILYTCADLNSANVSVFRLNKDQPTGNNRKGRNCNDEESGQAGGWCKGNILDGDDLLLQLSLSETENHVLGTTALGFCIWNAADFENKTPSAKRIDLKLPTGVRNISVSLLQSNSIILSKNDEFAVAGVRKNLYVWKIPTGQLVKVLDAHFGRILAIVPYTIGPWNSVITSSIDRSVKVWNLNNVFEQVHVIDRHELQIDSISLCQTTGVAVTVTRGCVGVWHILTGKLMDKLAYNALGAIVTHALITQDGRHILAAESGSILIWEWPKRRVCFRAEQPSVKQIMLMEEDTKFLTASRLGPANEGKAVVVVRDCPNGVALYEVEIPVRTFRPAILTNDGLMLVMQGHEKNRDYLYVFQSQTGVLIHKFIPRYQGAKKDQAGLLIPVPGKATQVALMDQDKGVVFDVRTKKHIRTIRRWSGQVTKDGRLGLYAPSRGGLELIELRSSSTVSQLISRSAEGVFTNVTSFNATDQYVLYYHSGHKTLRVFRVLDGQMLANYRLAAELTAIDTTTDGRCVVIGTLDGCLSVLAIADPAVPGSFQFLASLPSRTRQTRIPSAVSGESSRSDQDGDSNKKNRKGDKESGGGSHITLKAAATVAASWAKATQITNNKTGTVQKVTSKACVIS